MCSDLVKIKDKYGERMMHLCRKNFSTILEEDGRLFKILSDHFAYSKDLYDDIINNDLVSKFSNYVYKLYQSNDDELFEDNRTPFELLEEAGYSLYECRTEGEIRSFIKYYDSREVLCSFKGYRLRTCYVFFAVKKNALEIKREDFINPYRQDAYGTSVISIQFTKGDFNTLSIKNRYNHTVINPDATFSNNLENIIPGLTRSFEKYYNLNISQNKSGTFEIPGYVLTRDGKYYKYNYEINNIYYCPNNIIIDDFCVIDSYQEKEKYIVMDYFVVDLVNKKISLYDKNITLGDIELRDSFLDTIDDIKKIDIVRYKESKNRRIKITYRNDKYIFIEIDKCNRMISYSDNNILDIPDNFLKHNIYLERIDIPNVIKIKDNFLYSNRYLKDINALSVIEIGDSFLYKNNSINFIDFPKLVRVGDNFITNNRVINKINIISLAQVGDNFLMHNKDLKEMYVPCLVYVDDNFISGNRILENICIDNLVNVGDNFLGGNKAIKTMCLNNLRQVGNNFLYCNDVMKDFCADNLEIIGDNFMVSNRDMINLRLSKLRMIGNKFLYKNNSLRYLELLSLCKVGHSFMKDNNSLKMLIAPNLIVVGIDFLCKNSVLEYVDMFMLEDYGKSFLDNSLDVKRKVLGY